MEDMSIYENGFNNINAYILGIIFTDGCLYISKSRSKESLRLNITLCNYEIMKTIHDLMTPQRKLYTYRPKLGINDCYSVISKNEIDIQFLMKLGLVQRKSLVVRIPKIPKEYEIHFLRGVFDGNGCVYNSTTKTISGSYKYKFISFTTGSLGFAEDLYKLLLKYNIDSRIVIDSRTKSGERGPTYYVKIYKKNHVIRFYNLIYDDAEIYMENKKARFK